MTAEQTDAFPFTEAELAQRPDLARIAELVPDLTTGPWLHVNEFEGENWLLGSWHWGASPFDDKDHYVTTDHVHASELCGDPAADAEFMVRVRNHASWIVRRLIWADMAEAALRAGTPAMVPSFNNLPAMDLEAARAMRDEVFGLVGKIAAGMADARAGEAR